MTQEKTIARIRPKVQLRSSATGPPEQPRPLGGPRQIYSFGEAMRTKLDLAMF